MAFDAELMQRYDVRGPRYTSYPTALQFSEAFDREAYREMALASNQEPIPRDLSVYLHLPFCEQACWYCACHRSITRRPDRGAVYLDNLAHEMETQARMFDRDRVLRQLHLGGGTPTFHDTDALAGLLACLASNFHFAEPGEREYSVEIDPRSVTPQDLEQLVSLGFNRFSMGVQDFNEQVQEAVNRLQPYSMVAEQVAAARAAGVGGINFDLIYGLPHQTVDSFRHTLEQVVALAPDRLSIYAYAHLPERFPIQGLMPATALPNGQERLALFSTAVEVLSDAGYQHIGMDHFAHPEDSLVQARDQGRLQRNFQGYSTHADCDLIGLGASAIGQIGDSYSQNVANIRDWQDQVSQGHLAINRGILLSADDRIRQQVIQSIMCNGRLEAVAVERRHHVDFWSYFASTLPALRQMEADGLLEFSGRDFEVTAMGRFLLRNVAMLFDAYNGPSVQQKRFSRVI